MPRNYGVPRPRENAYGETLGGPHFMREPVEAPRPRWRALGSVGVDLVWIAVACFIACGLVWVAAFVWVR